MAPASSSTTVLESDKVLIGASRWFDGAWYASRYPDVPLSGIDPLEHYFSFGERLGRKAGPHFDAGFYRTRYTDVAASGISPLLHFIRYGEAEGRAPHHLEARDWETLLWQRDDVERCLKALDALLTSTSDWEASHAGWALARWHAWQGEWQRCLDAIGVCQAHPAIAPKSAAVRLLEIEAMTRCSRLDDAYKGYLALRESHPGYLDAWLVFANILAVQSRLLQPVAERAQRFNEQLRLEAINTIYRENGLEEVVHVQAEAPLSLDALVTKAIAPAENDLGEVTVSVIVPVFNAGAHLHTALQSLAMQTLKNIEIIVVDDASSDDSFARAQRFAQRDPRFKAIRQPRNQGAYAARNRGLDEVQGRYITVHDSDDWSHPEKLERQVMALEANLSWRACCSDMVRCTTELYFGRWRVAERGGWVYRNTSSLMMRREVIDCLGYWDRVRCSADSEYIQRLVAAFGPQAVGNVMPGVPLSLCRDQPSSLSQAGATHLVTHFKGLRHDYMAAAAQWHASAQGSDTLYMPNDSARRPFEAPGANLRE